jgi:hypothetical protein
MVGWHWRLVKQRFFISFYFCFCFFFLLGRSSRALYMFLISVFFISLTLSVFLFFVSFFVCVLVGSLICCLGDNKYSFTRVLKESPQVSLFICFLFRVLLSSLFFFFDFIGQARSLLHEISPLVLRMTISWMKMTVGHA